MCVFFFSIIRRHTSCALVTGGQTCALPIYGHARVLNVDPATGAIREAEPKGEAARAMLDAKRPGKVYSKWRYVPEVDAFFGITNVDLGFVLYRLDRSAAAPAPAVLHTVAADRDRKSTRLNSSH